MDNELVLFSVKDAGQDVGLLPVPVEEAPLVDVHDQDVVAVDHLGDARVSIVSDHAFRFRPNHSGSPHGSLTASQKSLSVSISRPRRSTISSLSVIAAD